MQKIKGILPSPLGRTKAVGGKIRLQMPMFLKVFKSPNKENKKKYDILEDKFKQIRKNKNRLAFSVKGTGES